MLDYMMWPWSERSKVPSALHDKKFQFPTEKFPKLVKYPQLIMQNNLCSGVSDFTCVCYSQAWYPVKNLSRDFRFKFPEGRSW